MDKLLGSFIKAGIGFLAAAGIVYLGYKAGKIIAREEDRYILMKAINDNGSSKDENKKTEKNIIECQQEKRKLVDRIINRKSENVIKGLLKDPENYKIEAGQTDGTFMISIRSIK
ncbi:MAG: hypothetical protein SPI49_03545 [Eubacteriales bacterium]|nr:hypothetical protein [Eubacteriales bacterium]